MSKLAVVIFVVLALGAAACAPLRQGAHNYNEETNRAVVLVIDKSGSMREENRLLYAQEAAKAVVAQLEEGDLVGVVGFDIEPFVVVPLASVERIRGTFNSQIDRLKAGGRTYIYPAIVEAKRQLERQTAAQKHVIILSDGETGGSGSDYIDLVTVMKKELKITVSAVAIGNQANIPLMKRIAQYGGGFFHHTYDPSTLPQIVLERALGDTAAAQGSDDAQKCYEAIIPDSQVNRESALHYCSQAVQSGQLSKEYLARSFNNSGNVYYAKKDYDRAIQDYDQTIRLNPSYALAFYNRGLAYYNKKDYGRAIEDYDQAIRLNANYASAFNNRGNVYRAKRDYDRAIQDYNEGIRLDPKYAAAFNNRGNVYRDKKDYDRALHDYDRAIQLNPNYALAFNNRGIAYRAKKDYNRSLADYEAAARIDPKAARDKSMGYTLFYLGRVVQSAEAMERAVKAAPRDMYAILWRYIMQAKEGGLETASRELSENAGKLKEPRWPAPVIDFYLGKIDEKEMYAAAEHLDPKKKSEQVCEADFYAAEAKLLKGATEEAIPLLRAAEKDCPPTFYEAHGASAELRRLGY